ncbi:uncharacterized protein LOC143071755 isoform X3 [Mytilus galloprovincialis]|uniref:uncharacterized protein LOC143071755 isoform X3 n=1 Tax=Mytilus galloprovincialis TaxID=29158 RepID=UPI003F7C940D
MILCKTFSVFLLLYSTEGRECPTCELRYWGSWGNCDQQCGGGMRIRYREVCCPEIIDYHTCARETCKGIVNLSEIVGKGSCNLDCYNGGIYNETCQCKPGWSGRCCETNCDDGYFGDGCNSTCNCQTDAICDKETGACLQEALSSDGYIHGRKRRKAKITARLDKEKFWSGKTALDGPENLYEEIPFDIKGENNSKISKIHSAISVNKTSVKKTSIKNGIVKVKETKILKSEDIYQGLAKDGGDCGYQALIDPDAIKYMAMKPVVINLDNPVYLPMSDSQDKRSDKALDNTKAAEYMAMYTASGDTCENKKKLYYFDVE